MIMFNNKKEKGCPFCKIQGDIIARNNLAIAIADKYPIASAHMFVVSPKTYPVIF